MASRVTVGRAQREALDIIWTLLIGGALVTASGAGLAAVSWPHPQVVHDAPASEQHTGYPAFAHLSLAVAGIGLLVLLAGIVAYGVKLGVQAAHLPAPAAQADRPEGQRDGME